MNTGNFEKPSFYETDSAEWTRETDFLRSVGLHVPPHLMGQAGQSDEGVFWRYPSSCFWEAPPDSIDKTDFVADLSYLQFAIGRAYAGAEQAARKGWDWNSFFSRWRNYVLAWPDQKILIQLAFRPWQELASVQLDNHSGPKIPGVTPALSQTLIVSEADDKALTHIRNAHGDVLCLSARDLAHQPWPAFCSRDAGGPLTRCRALSYPSRQGETWVAAKAGAWVPLIPLPVDRDERAASLRSLGARDEAELFYRELKPDVAYLRIPTLTPETAWAATSLTRSLGPAAFQKSAIVFDLRGNGGGSAAAVYKILDCVPGWRELDWQNSFTMDVIHSSMSDALQWGEVQRQLKDIQIPLATGILRHAQAVLDKAYSAKTDATDQATISRFSSGRSFRDHQFPWHPKQGHPRVYILTDSDCGSDGEFIAYTLSLIPGSVIVGTATGGVAQFARPGCLLLPRTRIPFRLASAFIDIHGDGRAFDGYGLKPDILLSHAEPLSPEKLLLLLEQAANLLAALPVDAGGTVE